MILKIAYGPLAYYLRKLFKGISHLMNWPLSLNQSFLMSRKFLKQQQQHQQQNLTQKTAYFDVNDQVLNLLTWFIKYFVILYTLWDLYEFMGLNVNLYLSQSGLEEKNPTCCENPC